MVTKLISGKVSTSKKSAERRCASRSAWRVSMLAARMFTLAEEAAGSVVSRCAPPSNSLNWPRTVVTIACRAEKPIRLWVMSSV